MLGIGMSCLSAVSVFAATGTDYWTGLLDNSSITTIYKYSGINDGNTTTSYGVTDTLPFKVIHFSTPQDITSFNFNGSSNGKIILNSTEYNVTSGSCNITVNQTGVTDVYLSTQDGGSLGITELEFNPTDKLGVAPTPDPPPPVVTGLQDIANLLVSLITGIKDKGLIIVTAAVGIGLIFIGGRWLWGKTKQWLSKV
jgi:hypothetical protein